MVSKKYMIWSIIVTLICLALGITCAVYRPDTLSYVLLGVVIFFAVLISISVFVEIVAQNKEAKKLGTDKDKAEEEIPAIETEEAPIEVDAEVESGETEETPVEETSADETVESEAPTEEVSTEEAPVEEIVEETTEEKPADDKDSDEE